MVSRDLRRIRDNRASGGRQRVTDMGIDRTQALKREKAKAEKFRSITKDLNQTRLDASARFKRGDRVTNGKQTGTVDSINPTTGDVMVRVRGRSLPMNPEFLTHES